MVSALLLLVTIVLVLAADPLITLVGPGLSPELHRIAAVQLQVMAPMALLAGLIGLGFGSLNAADEFWIPAISPLMSSLALILGIGLLWWQAGSLRSQLPLSRFGEGWCWPYPPWWERFCNGFCSFLP
jgi:putative peptidoglycan lipid II flippase